MSFGQGQITDWTIRFESNAAAAPYGVGPQGIANRDDSVSVKFTSTGMTFTGAVTFAAAGAIAGAAGAAGSGTTNGSAGSALTFTGGAGGAKTGTGTANGGAGASSTNIGGAGGATAATAGTAVGGAGGNAGLTGGVGGAATAGTANGGAGGSIPLQPGPGGASAGGIAGQAGVVYVAGTAPMPFLQNQAIAALADTDATVTAADVRSGIWTVATGATNRTKTTPAASALISTFPGIQVGSVIELTICNLKAANTVTLGLGAGVTAAGGTNLVVAAAAAVIFKLVATNVGTGTEAFTVVRAAG